MGLLVSGNNPAALKTAERSYFTATAGQTIFPITSRYAPGDVDVFLNGIRLVESDDYFAVDGINVVLSAGANAGDNLTVICYYQFQAAGSYTKAESDSRYMTASGVTPMTSFLRTPNYGISSTGDNLSTELTAAAVGQQGVGVKAYGRSMSTFGGDLHMIADNRGAGGSHRFYSWNGTSLSTMATLDSTGRLSVQNQPIASVSYSGGDLASTNTIPLNNRPITRGGMTIVNNRITVPISGTYIVGFHHLATSNGCQISIRVNGVDINGGGGSRSQGHAPTAHDNMSVQNPVYINANEYIEFFIINSTMHGNADYNRMYAYLVA